jgi:glutamate:GABA antiporter
MSEPTTGLVRRLGLFDLALAQVLLVIGTNWFGVAAKLGGAGLGMWLLAVLLFHLPLAAVVIHLTRRLPLEGGSYAWARQTFGPGVGFLVGWSFWAFVIVYTAAAALTAASSFAYAVLPQGAAGIETRGLLAAATLAALGAIVLAALWGLGRTRFLHSAGALALLAVMALLAIKVGTALLAGKAGALRVSAPPLTLETLAMFSKLTVYGLAGLECLSILAAEVRDPERTLPRSVALAAPVNGLIYLIGTAAVLVTVERSAIDLVNPVAQVLAQSGGALATAVIGLLLLRDLAQASQAFAATARLPMVAGWDHLLPAALGRLSREGTPRNAILLCGAAAAGVGLAAVATAGRQEAFQLLLSAAGILFALTYVVLFAMPLFAGARLGLPRSWTLRLAAASGLGLTLLFIAFSVYPIVEVDSPARFALRVLAAVAVLEGLGVIVYLRGRSRSTS